MAKYLSELYRPNPRAEDEMKFWNLHKQVQKWPDPQGNDDIYTGTISKTVDRKKTKSGDVSEGYSLVDMEKQKTYKHYDHLNGIKTADKTSAANDYAKLNAGLPAGKERFKLVSDQEVENLKKAGQAPASINPRGDDSMPAKKKAKHYHRSWTQQTAGRITGSIVRHYLTGILSPMR